MNPTLYPRPGFLTALRSCRARGGYTLVELLLVITVLGLAGAMVIPSMSSTGAMRIQASVRTLVADMTFMQSDAMAFQARRVMVFGKVAQWNPGENRWDIVDGNGYTLYAIAPGAGSLDIQNAWMDDIENSSRPYSRDFDDSRYGGGVISNPQFNGGSWLIFDELGGPVQTIDGDSPGVTGFVEVLGQDAAFTVTVEAYTGRVTVARTQ